MPRPPRRSQPAPPVDRLDDEPLPPRPHPGAWPPGASVPLADRQHRPRRLALALTRASGLALAIAVTTALLLVSPVGTRRETVAIAERELASLLAPGERVLALTTVAQRRSADVWRRSYGLLAATSRRLVHVGAAPLPLVRPADPGPRPLLLTSWPYDAEMTLVTEADGDDGTLSVRTPSRTRHFRTADADGARALQRAVTDIQQQRDGERSDSVQSY